MVWVLLFASIIILFLSALAAYYSLAWRKRKIAIERHFEDEEKLVQEKRESAKQGIYLISRAYLQDQVSATESAMRISRLSSALSLTGEQSEVLQVFDKLAQETAHIPILDEWKKLSRKEQFQFEKIRYKAERKYEDFIRQSSERIAIGNFFDN